jgi:hypothetical protein
MSTRWHSRTARHTAGRHDESPEEDHVQVELLYFDGCPSWQVADQRLLEALALAGRGEVPVHRRRVETPEEADELGFIGSPSIRVDGRDPFAVGGEQVGLSCRMYPTPAGLRGSPEVEQLVEALS